MVTAKRSKEWEAGARAAAAWASEYDGSSTHAYRLEDCILGKMNLWRGAPRKNVARVATQPKEAITLGFVLALAEMVRATGDASAARAVAVAAGLTIAEAKKAGSAPGDLRTLRKAGVPRVTESRRGGTRR